ncbi:DUF6491 family protein [Caulobacter sp. UNC358MFTsu5.1]|uniref:DUF6491 family protein n=1 Tax=Caulobacter sp. UNC358MFTsu5.1 TaxID=1449049 RepID=UPI0004A6D30B|nr:DUF6491 family protein [Caulobacter sp. UNC358MFTsu5.1]
MNTKTMIRAGLLTTVLLAAAAPALAAAEPAAKAPAAKRSCFYMSEWDNWSAPDRDTLYLKVRNRDVYQVDLSHGTSMLTSPGVHLVSIQRGVDSVCSPLDLDLRVSDGWGMAMPIMAKSITKLTPEQIAAIPKKDRP